MLSSAFVIFRKILTKNDSVSVFKVTAITIFCLCLLFAMAMAVLLTVFGDLLVKAWNELLELEELLNSSNFQTFIYFSKLVLIFK